MNDQLTAKIEAARKRADQARAKLQALEARASQQVRKQDTRRKVILGGLLLDAAGKDERFSRTLSTLLERLTRDQDKKAFEGWQPPSPTPQPPLNAFPPLSELPRTA